MFKYFDWEFLTREYMAFNVELAFHLERETK